MFERLTRRDKKGVVYAPAGKPPSYVEFTGISADRLAAYEDSELSPEEVHELAKAKADERLWILPVKPGDIIYRPEALQYCWMVIRAEICEDEILFIDDSDNIFSFDDIGKTVFLTREAAEKALSPICNTTKLQCAECNPCCEHRKGE